MQFPGVCDIQNETDTFWSAAAVSAIYPFFSDSHAWLLLMVVFLGMFSGLAFGSSYQLVSKFPAKNSVALTLGAPRFGLSLPCPISNFVVWCCWCAKLDQRGPWTCDCPCHHAPQTPWHIAVSRPCLPIGALSCELTRSRAAD